MKDYEGEFERQFEERSVMTTVMRLNLVADSLDVLKLPSHVQAVREAAAEIEALRAVISSRDLEIKLIDEKFTSLRARVEELEKDNAALHDRCICAFCKQEFSKRDLAAVADHLTNCEQSPLVKRGKELFEMCNTFEAKIAELERDEERFNWAIDRGYLDALVDDCTGTLDTVRVAIDTMSAEKK